jgi:hypothetical protein
LPNLERSIVISQILRAIVPARMRPAQHLARLAWRRNNGRVATGPFRGLRYALEAIGSALVPKLLGIYERELHPAIERAIAEQYELIIDVGAAEGYYAVGMAVRCPGTPVVAFEVDPRGQAATRRTAELNGVGEYLSVRGRCAPSDLVSILDGRRALIICDCEGDEQHLLDPVAIPALAAAAILVEVHDFVVPGVGNTLEARFAATHNLERIWQTDRAVTDFPYSDWYSRLLPRRYLEWGVSEQRPERMSWLCMAPRPPACS